MFAGLIKRVRDRLIGGGCEIPAFTCAASLAHHGLLGSVDAYWLMLENDLTSIPAEHMASFISSFANPNRVTIGNVSGCDLVTILDTIKSDFLIIDTQSLDREETQALVRAMETRLERVMLSEGVTLDIRALFKYSGQGKCREVRCDRDTMARYKEELTETWAKTRNWEVTAVTEIYFQIQSR